jgi:hypothetical protein
MLHANISDESVQGIRWITEKKITNKKAVFFRDALRGRIFLIWSGVQVP